MERGRKTQEIPAHAIWGIEEMKHRERKGEEINVERKKLDTWLLETSLSVTYIRDVFTFYFLFDLNKCQIFVKRPTKNAR